MLKKATMILVLLFCLTGMVIAPPAAESAGAAGQKKEQVVFVTDTGKKYHREGCRRLRKSKIQIEKSRAIAEGYTPCRLCRP